MGEVKDGSQGGEDVVDGLGALGGAFAAGTFGGIGAGEGAAGGGGFTRGGAELEAEGVDDERGDRVEAERAEAGEEMEVEVAGFVAGVGAGRVPEGEVGGGEGGEGGGAAVWAATASARVSGVEFAARDRASYSAMSSVSASRACCLVKRRRSRKRRRLKAPLSRMTWILQTGLPR
ncbi:MAG: hypothetical protein IPK80_28910 [Nannocystis sp.]|nr:hypothetical protein [Nannocystis sp.]